MFDNYQIWENYLYTCLDVREFEEAILSFHRIVELRWDKVSQPGKSVVDTEVNFNVKLLLSISFFSRL